MGFLTGRAYQAMHGGWRDYKVTKAKLPPLLKLFWAMTRTAMGWLVVTAVVVVALVTWAISGPAKPSTPAGPSPSVSPR